MLIINLMLIFIIMLTAATKSIEVSEKNEIEGESYSIVYESEVDDHDAVTSPANASDLIDKSLRVPVEVPAIITKFSRNLSEEDKYLLAKIAMAEAEGESIETKVYVILTVLNRANLENEYFPNTVEEVIFQNVNGIYQFSPVIPNGRWWNIEPNEECFKAVEIVNEMENDISMGALYFESCQGESWHSRNLEFIFESNNMRFYK